MMIMVDFKLNWDWGIKSELWIEKYRKTYFLNYLKNDIKLKFYKMNYKMKKYTFL